MSTVSRAHGLNGTLVEPDWPPLTLDEVRSLLAGFPDLRGPYELLSFSPRPFSAASIVAAGEQRVFIKRHARAVRDSAGLREEHWYMAHLRAHGAAVPVVYATESGSTAIESGTWTYEVHSTPHGVDLYEDALSWTPFFSEAHARSAGQAMARLHRAAKDYEAPVRTLRPLVAGFTVFAAKDPAAELNRYVGSRPALENYLRQSGICDRALELLAPYHAELLPLLPALTPLWTHNDLHPSNLLWNGWSPNAQASAIIDFGLCDRTNPVHDLAHAIERSIVEWLSLMESPTHPENVRMHLDHMMAMLDGYETVRPLSSEEAAALAPMAALCHAEFALSEADYFLSVLHSNEKARVACEDYLLDHARWFRGSGVVLLDALRRWADTKQSHGAIER